MAIKEIFNSFTATSLDHELTVIALNIYYSYRETPENFRETLRIYKKNAAMFYSTGVSHSKNQKFWKKYLLRLEKKLVSMATNHKI